MLTGIKIIPVILGITGVVGGGSFGLTTYLMNNYGQQIKERVVSERKNSDKPDNPSTLIAEGDRGKNPDENLRSPELHEKNDELPSPKDIKEVVEPIVSSLTNSQNDDHSLIQVEDNLDSHFSEDSDGPKRKEDYLKAKQEGRIMAQYIYRNNDYSVDEENSSDVVELSTTCEYWVDLHKENKKTMPQSDCEVLISENLETQDKNQPIMWLKFKEQGFSVIPKEHFYSLGSDDNYSSIIMKGESWAEGSFVCSSKQSGTSEIVISCEKSVTENPISE
ncbi:hypothetical protein [Mycoplasma suis]|uniref:Uncharacterized protein n=1 Tax=Mycoplasma suis (strain Illinois) TaxID=768700 RepID=F0QQH5_MYCSL|nr:hypothetical protein [Mycoplasma suis]ADX97745.1 hypothetical protein MSU_0201 [Mycoplasma suis str. Illinois]